MTWAGVLIWVKRLLANKYFVTGAIVFLVTSFLWWRMGSAVRRMAVARAWRQCERRCEDKGGSISPRKRLLPVFGNGEDESPDSTPSYRLEALFAESVPDDVDSLPSLSTALTGGQTRRVLALVAAGVCGLLWWSRKGSTVVPTVSQEKKTGGTPVLQTDRAAQLQDKKQAVRMIRRDQVEHCGTLADKVDALTLAEVWKAATDEELAQ